jgi:hypothetical protein
MINIIRKLIRIALPFELLIPSDLCGGQIKSRLKISGCFRCQPWVSGDVKTQSVIEGRFAAHSCGGVK